MDIQKIICASTIWNKIRGVFVMKMSLEAEKFLKKVYAILMLCLTLPGLVGAT